MIDHKRAVRLAGWTAVISALVFVICTVWISLDLAPTFVDTWAAGLAGDLRSGWLTDLFRVITDVGSAGVSFTLGLIFAVVLASSRRWDQVLVLIAASVISTLAVTGIKNLVERPRPDDALINVPSFSFPSGHASHAVFYAWAALVAIAVFGPRIRRPRLLLGAGIALTMAIGLSRVYLGVHHLTDVLAGWALGALVFALCELVALRVGRLRQNPPGDSSSTSKHQT